MMLEELWQTSLGELELLISKANFTTWFKNTYISAFDENRVIIATPNAFTKAWLEKKYHSQIIKALNNATGGQVKSVDYVVEIKKPQFVKPKLDAIQPRSNEVITNNDAFVNSFGLNSKYTFDSFIVGANNELSHAAAQAVAERPGQLYNPLFLYGGVGLGKTHLAQAAGNAILANFPKHKVLYISSEKFTDDFVQALKAGTIDQFKKHYRTVDVLIIDDIQFIAGKEQTQEEFFHTFNCLHQNNKQIILTSDRPPKAIPDIEQRLISRFEWGMITDIALPAYETRIAILQAKCQEKSADLDIGIVEFLAENIQNNIRELEGALNRLLAHHHLTGTQPTLDSAKQILQALMAASPAGNLTPKKVINIVATYFDIAVNDLIGNCRRKELVVPRQITMYLLREEIKSSFPSIGQELGGKDHTTAMHACNKISKAVESDDRIKNHVTSIRQKLYQG